MIDNADFGGHDGARQMAKSNLRAWLSKKDRTCYQISLSRAYHTILAMESELWSVGKGDFLTMLVRRKAGKLSFERPRDAPLHNFSQRDLEETERYAWYVPNRDLHDLDADRVNLGKVTVSTWATITLNNWIGLPEGISAESDQVYRRLPLNHLASPARQSTPDSPFWVIYEKDAKGEETGELWCPEPNHVCVFRNPKHAQVVAQHLAPPSGSPNVLGQRGVAWVAAVCPTTAS
jgi:hypothetical protein